MKKCTFFTEKSQYLGYFIGQGKLEEYNSHSTSLRQAKLPTIKSKTRSFLWFCNRLSLQTVQFGIHKNCLFPKSTPTRRSSEQFQTRPRLTEILQYIYRQSLFASDLGSTQCQPSIFGVHRHVSLRNRLHPLPDHDDGKWKPIKYCSRTLNTDERSTPLLKESVQPLSGPFRNVFLTYCMKNALCSQTKAPTLFNEYHQTV